MYRRTLLSYINRRAQCSIATATISPVLISFNLTPKTINVFYSATQKLDPYFQPKSQSSTESSSPFPCFSGLEVYYEYLICRCRVACTLTETKQFHLQIIKHGFVRDMFFGNTLINAYVRNSGLVFARQVFDEMPVRNSVSWASMVSGYAQSGSNGEACLVFKGILDEGVFPNQYAFGSVFRACQELGSCGLKLGMQVHGYVLKCHYAVDVMVPNALISLYGKLMDSGDFARQVFYDIKVKTSVSWNSIISVYSQKGDTVPAFKLFSAMQKETSEHACGPNEYTFGSLITAAASSGDYGFYLLKQMLCRVQKSGFLSDLYVGSAFISGLSRFGLIDYATKILELMTDRNVVTMNGLIVGLVRQKHGEEAAALFAKMRKSVDVNVDSFVILLSAFPEFVMLEKGKQKGREVHAYVIRTGFSDVAAIGIGNGLINMYAKCGSVSDAVTVFQLMTGKDLVSWNSVITGLDQNNCFEDAITCFLEMRRGGFMPCNFTLISTLSSCASLYWIKLGQQIHGEGIKLGLDLDVSVSNSLLALYADTGCVTECHKVFSVMPDHDQVSWNSMIGALADDKHSVFEAGRYFLDMMRAGWTLNNITFINILSAVSSLSLDGMGKQIHSLVLKYSLTDEVAIENALLALYGRSGLINECEKIFSRMSDRKDEVSWNSMISGYIHNDFLSKAMDLVWSMMQKGQKLDSFTFATVLSACASVATLERGMEVHACAIRGCLESDVVVGSALVDMYAKCGRVDYASQFFNTMPIKNVYSWNSMISGYARHGHGEEALKIFTRMNLEGQQPDHVTFVGVLSACSHVGLVKQGYAYFKSMSEEYGLTPRMEHFSCMVDLLGRAGELNKIEDFINEMPLKPNVLIWRTVLGACSRGNGRKTELGKRAAEMLFGLEPDNAVNYVLLANMYANGGKWEGVADARRAMKDAAVKKEAGCSWITMKDGVHVFVANDKLHPEKDLIYKKLKELNKKMRDCGYVPQTKFAMFDVEQENKEEMLSYHSEKLAVAFVLTRHDSRLPIRIMKNLRVCGDCHSALKYISKIVSRKIIVRDSNRFHHFNDGECSCGDYW